MWRLVPAAPAASSLELFLCALSLRLQCCVRAVPTDTRPSRLRGVDVLRPHRNAMCSKNKRAAGEELPRVCARLQRERLLHPACFDLDLRLRRWQHRTWAVRARHQDDRAVVPPSSFVDHWLPWAADAFLRITTVWHPSSHVTVPKQNHSHASRSNHFHGKSCQSIDYKQDQHQDVPGEHAAGLDHEGPVCGERWAAVDDSDR